MPVAVTIISPRPRDRGVHVGQADPVPQRDLGAGDRLGRLADREALAGQGGLLDLQGRGHGDAAVGRDPVARLHQHHVARHQLLGIHLHGLAVAADPGDGLHHLGQRLDALLGLGLLAQSDHGVEHRQAGQDDRGPDIPGDQQVNDGRGQQDELHEVLVLAQERLEAGLLLGRGEPVRAMRLEPAGRLRRAQPTLRVNPQLGGDRRRHRPMPARTSVALAW
jgi:hypothetical protein